MILLAALGNQLVRLGDFSLFIDEAFSWSGARVPVGDIWSQAASNDVTPPLYQFVLHNWIYLVDAESELALRLPSAIAAVGLVAAVYWLGLLLGGRRVGLVAALLTAVSPLVLQYGQQARTYIWLMLAVTVCVAAVVKAHLEIGVNADRSRVRRWLALAAIAAVAAVGFHYFSFLVLAPLCVWVVLRPEISQRAKVAFVGAIGLAGLMVFPLWLQQLGPENLEGIERFGRPTWGNILRVIGTPFDGRNGGAGGLGALLVLGALFVLARRATVPDAAKRSLIVWLAAIPPAALILFAIIGPDTLLSRYVSVSAPFMLVALALALHGRRRRVAAGVIGLTVLVSVGGIVNSHREEYLYPDMGSALSDVGRGWQRGDALLVAGYPDQEPALGYYRERSLPHGAPVARGFDAPALGRLRDRPRRLWVLVEPPRPRPALEADIARLGYEPGRAREFQGNQVLQLTLATRPAPGD